jgi:predicted dinucleotide-binding enzyme
MNIAVIGNGNIGSGLAKVLADAGHEVRVAGRGGDIPAAVGAADTVVLATPYGAIADVAGRADFTGKLVIDLSNPVTEDFQGLQLGHSTSAAEEIAARLPGARVVKALNTIFAQHYSSGLKVNGQPLQTFVASDDAEARGTVKALVESIGVQAVDAGPLKNARYLEPLGYMNIQLGYMLGQGTGIAPRWQLA